MHASPDLQRRSCLKRSAGLAVLVASGTLTACAAGEERGLQFSTLQQVADELQRLSAAPLDSNAVWSWSQTLEHCAQSIEFSMTGFPEPKSAVFQNTAGAAAFRFFQWRGRMIHNLAEPIPGAPPLAADAPAAASLALLQNAIAGFTAWTAPLQPHFAYGALSKPDYEQAHAMHLAQHLSGFKLKA